MLTGYENVTIAMFGDGDTSNTDPTTTVSVVNDPVEVEIPDAVYDISTGQAIGLGFVCAGLGAGLYELVRFGANKWKARKARTSEKAALDERLTNANKEIETLKAMLNEALKTQAPESSSVESGTVEETNKTEK